MLCPSHPIRTRNITITRWAGCDVSSVAARLNMPCHTSIDFGRSELIGWFFPIPLKTLSNVTKSAGTPPPPPTTPWLCKHAKEKKSSASEESNFRIYCNVGFPMGKEDIVFFALKCTISVFRRSCVHRKQEVRAGCVWLQAYGAHLAYMSFQS